MKLLDQTVWF